MFGKKTKRYNLEQILEYPVELSKELLKKMIVETELTAIRAKENLERSKIIERFAQRQGFLLANKKGSEMIVKAQQQKHQFEEELKAHLNFLQYLKDCLEIADNKQQLEKAQIIPPTGSNP